MLLVSKFQVGYKKAPCPELDKVYRYKNGDALVINRADYRRIGRFRHIRCRIEIDYIGLMNNLHRKCKSVAWVAVNGFLGLCDVVTSCGKAQEYCQ
jgi:hypothetical protein